MRYKKRDNRTEYYTDRRQGGARYSYNASGARKNKRKSPRRSKLILGIEAYAALFILGIIVMSAVMHWSYPMKYDQLVRENCARFGVDESLVYAVIRTESGFDPEARSDVGALGLMQITPDTFEWLQTKLKSEGGTMGHERLLEPEINIRYGVYFLSLLSNEFEDDTLTIAAYHAGRSQVGRWLASGQISTASDYDDIPSDTTGHYVYKVQKAQKMYNDLYYRDSDNEN